MSASSEGPTTARRPQSTEPPATAEPPASAERAVILPKHLHARPAGLIAQAAARYPQTTIEIVADGRRADARSILAVMALGAVAGSEVLVRTAGAQADGATATVVAILTAAED